MSETLDEESKNRIRAELRELIVNMADKQIWSQNKIPDIEVVTEFVKVVTKKYDL